jgi:hypothetical protein
MLIDLHVHTIFSGDSSIAPEDLIERALALELDGLAITEHDSYAASEVTAELAEGSGLCLFRGIEISSDLGHLLVFGLEDDHWQALRGPTTRAVPAQSLVQYVMELGGIVIPAHPFKSTSPSVGERVTSLVGVGVIEGFNGQCFTDENVQACELAQSYELKITGGSGAHYLGEVGRCITQFENRVATLSELVQELKAGRFHGRYFFK